MNDLEIAELEIGVRIDKHNLDAEFEEGPERVRKVNAELAFAISRRDGCKDDLKTLEANTELHVRSKKYDEGAKITDRTVEAFVNTDPDVIAKRKELIGFVQAVNELEGLKASYIDRSFALRALAELWVNGYYQTNSIRTQPNKEVQQRLYEKQRAEIAERRKQVYQTPPKAADTITQRRPQLAEEELD